MRTVNRLFGPLVGLVVLLGSGCEKSRPPPRDRGSRPTIQGAPAPFRKETPPPRQ